MVKTYLWLYLWRFVVWLLVGYTYDDLLPAVPADWGAPPSIPRMISKCFPSLEKWIPQVHLNLTGGPWSNSWVSDNDQAMS